VNDGFGIAVCIESVAEFFELRAEFQVVVNLAVENDPGGTVLVVNWLLAAFNVNDRKSPHSQTDSRIEVEAVIVWATVSYRGAHSRHEIVIDIQPVVTNNAYNSTHQSKTLSTQITLRFIQQELNGILHGRR